MSDQHDFRVKRLRFRSWRRGTREMDLLLGQFADRHLPALNATELDAYEALLEAADPDIFSWITGDAPLPARFDRAILELIRNYKAVTQ
jgi:antitoxin CptB